MPKDTPKISLHLQKNTLSTRAMRYSSVNKNTVTIGKIKKNTKVIMIQSI